MLDNGVNGGACFDHDLGLPWAFQRANELLERLGCNDVLSFGAAGFELFGDGGCPVVDGYGEAFALHVENEIFAHDGEADESDVTVSAHEKMWLGFWMG